MNVIIGLVILQVNRLHGQEVVRVSHMEKLGIDIGTIECCKCAWRDVVHLRARANKTLRDCPKCERCQSRYHGLLKHVLFHCLQSKNYAIFQSDKSFNTLIVYSEFRYIPYM